MSWAAEFGWVCHGASCMLFCLRAARRQDLLTLAWHQRLI
ncbi:unnamed protein product [Prunus armeniaca]|uniref:Uncharacterized protein n=1 Tax=Prunus armeniaca TaxID=36596 RepID=A0A6J5USZ2_PRUAR|nr:unnamed protein product [Prunus armeniaca]